MFSWIRLVRDAGIILIAVALCGCLPSGQGQMDDEKEPHFVLGKNRVNAMDYKGAIEAYEKSLEVNPRSSAAHFELGWLYAQKESDPAAAIYHYEKYLKLRPDSGNAGVIREHINTYKQDLAAAVLPLPTTPAVQRQLEQLVEQNRQLQAEVEKWRAYYASRGIAPTNSPFVSGGGAVRPSGAAGAGQSGSAGSVQTGSAQSGTAGVNHSTVTTTVRTHKVESGETPSSIARKYGVKVDVLLAANPGLDPRRMRVGQALNIPSP